MFAINYHYRQISRIYSSGREEGFTHLRIIKFRDPCKPEFCSIPKSLLTLILRKALPSFIVSLITLSNLLYVIMDLL